jgi:putative Holliday junction resolvase
MPEPHAPRARSFLAFDFSLRRVGVAAGSTVTGGATPLATIELTGPARFDAIGSLIAAWRPDALVVGVAQHGDGGALGNTPRARRFARQLRGRFALPVHEVDEGYTSAEARAAGARDVDAAAAALILEQYLRDLPEAIDART